MKTTQISQASPGSSPAQLHANGAACSQTRFSRTGSQIKTQPVHTLSERLLCNRLRDLAPEIQKLIIRHFVWGDQRHQGALVIPIRLHTRKPPQ